MEVDGRVAYEIALNRVLEKEKQIIELMSAYNQAMQLVETLQKELDELKQPREE